MVEQRREVRPPRGLSRCLYRFPILFFKLGLGGLMGKRFLLLTHIGRISGLLRYAVLEVIRHDEIQETYYVLSAFGDQSDWARNVRINSEVEITVGGRHYRAVAEILSTEEAENEVLDYARRYPFAAQQLPRLVGYEVDGSEESFRILARKLLVFRFRPFEV